MVNQIMDDAEKKFATSVDHLKSEFATLRSAHVSPALVEDIEVKAYDDSYTLKELAAISLADTNSLLIQPWDSSTNESIEKALVEAELGANPVVEGNNIRLNIPSLSEERRQEMAKKVGTVAEEARVAVRNIRQDKMKSLDGLEDEGKISEDDRDRAKETIEEMVKETNEEIEVLKEKKIESLTKV